LPAGAVFSKTVIVVFIISTELSLKNNVEKWVLLSDFAHMLIMGTHSSIVGWGTMLQARRSRVWDTMRSLNFIIYLILPATIGLGVYSASNRNEYQKQKKVFLGIRV
jgi:hypothetical protein